MNQNPNMHVWCISTEWARPQTLHPQRRPARKPCTLKEDKNLN